MARVSAFAAASLPMQDRLGELDIPVAEGVPGEMVERVGGVVELEVLDRRGDARRRSRASDAAIQRLTVSVAPAGSKPGTSAQLVHLGIARRVPQLGREVAIALDAALGELDVAALRRQRRQGEAQRVGSHSAR